MLKKVVGRKGALLFSFIFMIAFMLSGCGNSSGKTADSEPVKTVDSEPVKMTDSEPVKTENPSNTMEAAVPAQAQNPDSVKTETKETAKQNEAVPQPSQAKTSVTLTDGGKDFLLKMCNELNDFNTSTMDETFWRNFLFNSYTGVTSENAVTEQVYREDLEFEETVVKVSLQEAEEHAKLVLGVELPDVKPSFEDMEKGQTSFYYKDGYYYIGVSGLPDYQYTFSESVADKGNDINTIVKYTIDFMGESNIGTVTFHISPENNENGFVIRSKTTEFYK